MGQAEKSGDDKEVDAARAEADRLERATDRALET
jgi:hypothetical protein